MSLEIKGPSVGLKRSSSHSKISSIVFIVILVFANKSASGDGGLLPTEMRNAGSINSMLSALQNAGRYWSNRNTNSGYGVQLIKQRVPRSNAEGESESFTGQIYKSAMKWRATI